MRFKCIAKDCASPMIHVVAYGRACAQDIYDVAGVSRAFWLTSFEDNNCCFALSENEILKQGTEVLEKLKDPDFFSLADRESRRSIENMVAVTRSYRYTNWPGKTNEELFSAYEALFNAFVQTNLWGHVVNAVDFDHNMFSSRLLSLLEKKIKASKAGIGVAEAFAVLTMPLEKPPLTKQEESFFNVLALVQENGFDYPVAVDALCEHTRNYDWIQFQYNGPVVLDESYFRELLEYELKQGVSANEKLLQFDEKLKQTREKQANYIHLLGLSSEDEYWFSVAQVFAFLKLLRKDAVYQSSCWSRGLVKEIGKRIGLTELQTRYLLLPEVKTALVKGCFDSSLVEERMRFSVCFTDDKTEGLYTGEKARELIGLMFFDEVDESVSELRGSPASPGFARGAAKIVNKAEDMAKMNPGDVLVSHATNPNLVPAMKKASAILTDEGGITCHAAIVSRELNVPCVVGLKAVTSWLKDGDLIEVDANKGTVKKL